MSIFQYFHWYLWFGWLWTLHIEALNLMSVVGGWLWSHHWLSCSFDNCFELVTSLTWGVKRVTFWHSDRQLWQIFRKVTIFVTKLSTFEKLKLSTDHSHFNFIQILIKSFHKIVTFSTEPHLRRKTHKKYENCQNSQITTI